MDKSLSSRQNLNKAFSLCVLAYTLALFAAVLLGYVLRELHPVITIFIADIGATLVIYTFSRIFQNTSFYDPYWSLAPLVIALYLVLLIASEYADTARQIAVIILLSIWGLRLTYNWASQWQGLNHEDWRYTHYRNKTKRWFWLLDLVGLEMMPTFIVFLACLSLYPALAVGENPFGMFDFAAVAITAAAIAIEVIADRQLRIFKRESSQSDVIMSQGLWAYSRHPNYFGEVLFWWGLYIFALAADAGYWWVIIGPLSMTVLFVTVSIPLMERRNLEKRPGYESYQKRVSALIPWFPNKESNCLAENK